MFPEMEGSFADELYSESLQLSKIQLDSTANLISKQSGSDGNLINLDNRRFKSSMHTILWVYPLLFYFVFVLLFFYGSLLRKCILISGETKFSVRTETKLCK